MTADISSCRHLPDSILSILGQPFPHRRSRRSIRAHTRCCTALCGAYFSRRLAPLTAPAKWSWEDRNVHFPPPRCPLWPFERLARLSRVTCSFLSRGRHAVCASWGLSRTYLTSPNRKLGHVPCPRPAPAPGRAFRLASKIPISTNISRRVVKTSSVCIKTEIEKNDTFSQLIEPTNCTFPYPGLAQGDNPSPGP